MKFFLLRNLRKRKNKGGYQNDRTVNGKQGNDSALLPLPQAYPARRQLHGHPA